MKPLTNDAQVRAATAQGGKRTIYTVASCKGLRLRVSPSGAKSWSLSARVRGGAMTTTTIGTYPEVSLAKARELGDGARVALRDGVVPNEVRRAERAVAEEATASDEPYRLEAKVESGSVGPASLFIEQHAKPNQRTWEETLRILNVYVLPRWAGRHVLQIKRSDVVKLMDVIASENGLVMADHVLAVIRTMLNWYMAREDDYVCPIVKGMARTNPSERARTRILDDAELRAFWQATGKAGMFGTLTRFLLLAGCREGEALEMRRNKMRSLLSFECVWTVKAEDYKTKRANHTPLTPALRAILAGLPQWKGHDALIWSLKGKVAIGNITKLKRKLDAAMLALLQQDDPHATLPNWTIHDLRRTARSLMSRAGVPREHAEQVLGHVIRGVEGVYDQHNYIEEKHAALLKLGALVERITTGATAEVVKLRA
jgi:integrase